MELRYKKYNTCMSSIFKIMLNYSFLYAEMLIMWQHDLHVIQLVLMPLSSNTIFIPLGVPSSITMDCIYLPHIVVLIRGCIPPGQTFMRLTLRASSAKVLNWSNSYTIVWLPGYWIYMFCNLYCIITIIHELFPCPIAFFLRSILE